MEKGSLTKRIFLMIKSAFFFLLIIYLIGYILLQVFLPDQTAKIAQIKLTNVISDSMEPDFKFGDTILVYNHKLSGLNPNDIIMFKTEVNIYNEKTLQYEIKDTYVTHYIDEIISNDNDTFTYKTKSNKGKDNWIISEKQIIGKLGFVLPSFGVIIAFFQSVLGVLVIIINVIIGIIIYKLKKRDKNTIIKR